MTKREESDTRGMEVGVEGGDGGSQRDELLTHLVAYSSLIPGHLGLVSS